MFRTLRSPDVLAVTLAAAGILMVTMGTRQSLGLPSAMGSGAGSCSVLIGAASGVINGGGAFGQFVFAAVLQKLIQSVGWAAWRW